MNTKEKIKFIYSMAKYSITHPECGINFVNWYYNVSKDAKHSIHKFKNYDTNINDVLALLFPNIEIPEYDLNELNVHFEQFFQKLDLEKYPSKKKPYPLEYSLENESALLLYLICKILKPKKVVETGVAYGLSSSYILQAMNENNYGELYSLDYLFRPWESKQMIGSIIPNYLRNRFNLVYGIASKKLKQFLLLNKEIDIFIHDSDHTYKNMMFEYDISWPHIKKGGLLISDDVESSNAFYDFSIKKDLKPILFFQDLDQKTFLGILQKPI